MRQRAASVRVPETHAPCNRRWHRATASVARTARAVRRPSRYAAPCDRRDRAVAGSSSTPSTPNAAATLNRPPTLTGSPTPSSASIRRRCVQFGTRCLGGRSASARQPRWKSNPAIRLMTSRSATKIGALGSRRRCPSASSAAGVTQDRMDAEALTRDQPLDDEPSFGDEQPGGLQPARRRRRDCRPRYAGRSDSSTLTIMPRRRADYSRTTDRRLRWVSMTCWPSRLLRKTFDSPLSTGCGTNRMMSNCSCASALRIS